MILMCWAFIITSYSSANENMLVATKEDNTIDSFSESEKKSSINSIMTPDGLLLYYNGADLSEIYDENNPTYIYDIDDFDTLEEYYKYCDSSNIKKMPKMQQRSITDPPSTTVTGICKFELTHNNAIQSFAYDGSYIYISQAYVNLTFNGVSYPRDPEKPDNLVLITKCKKKAGDSKTYVPDSYMLLIGVGHGQTLEVYKHNNKKYLLISCTGQKLPKGSKDRWWSTQLGRVEFTPNAVIENENIKRLIHVECIAPNSSNIGDVKRVDGALSESGKKLLIWVRPRTQAKDMYAGFNFDTINTLWDSCDELDFSSNAQLQHSKEFTFFKDFETEESMQGLSMSNVNSHKYTIFNASGNESLETNNYLFSYESSGSGESLKGAKIDDTGVWSLCNKDYKKLNILAEIEGVKLKSGYLHFVLRDAQNQIGKVQVLAKIAKSKLKKIN